MNQEGEEVAANAADNELDPLSGVRSMDIWKSAATTRGPNQRAKADSVRDSQVASCMLPGN